ncbi:MAG: hypothetical protein UDP17_05385, partial [Treponema sp.]|nr:hypothetical protein [Treponema sp.]
MNTMQTSQKTKKISAQKTSVFWSTFSPQNKGFGGIMEESFLITNGPVRSFYNELIENLNSCSQ